jgi:hypothetical protein
VVHGSCVVKYARFARIQQKLAHVEIFLHHGRVPSSWIIALCALAAVSGAGTQAWAEDAGSSGSASAALGAGVIDARAATSLDLGVDVAGEHYAMGLGARLRWVISGDSAGGFRAEDWDDRSEWASLVRYLTYARAHGTVDVALALGQLGGVTLGHGSLVDGYSAGLDVDHRHLGVALQVRGERVAGEFLLDDLVAPRIAGTRMGWRTRGSTFVLDAGASVVTDLAAEQAAAGAAGAMSTTMSTVVPVAALDGRAQWLTRDGRWGGALYTDVVAIADIAVGAHLGISGYGTLFSGTRVSLRGELRGGSDHYIPGWFGPFYELDRRVALMGPEIPTDGMDSQLEVARRGGLAGWGGLVEAQVHVPEIGDFAVYYARRAQLADHLVVRANVPFLRDVQGAAWLAAEVGDGADAWILASEIRARVNARWFVSAELSRLYIQRDTALEPILTGLVTFGATVGL